MNLELSSPRVSAVLFVKDRKRAAAFYVHALGMQCQFEDEYHSQLTCCGFELVVHQIPEQYAQDSTIDSPPERRVATALRLDYPVKDLAASRLLAKQWGGQIDDAPPEWAGTNANVFLGFDPEGNVFKVSEIVA